MPDLFISKVLTVNNQRGFGLVELMVALVISLILIGGAISIFISAQQTSRAQQDLDEAQDAFRFGSQTIMRVVRQANELSSNSDEDVLRVRMDGAPDSGIRDCLGRQVVEMNVESEFRLDGNQLSCRVFEDGALQEEAVLVAGLESVEFRYSGSGTYWEESVRDGGSLRDSSDWGTVPNGDSRSVAVRLQMENSGLQGIFTATSRALTVNQ